MNQQKFLRLLVSEIELHGYVNESKGIHVKNFLITILKSLKQSAFM